MYIANTKFVKDSRDNSISRAQIGQQLASAPAPHDKALSGYPHKFENKNGQIQELKIPRLQKAPSSVVSGASEVSSTTSHYEYPVFGDSHTFDWHTKKKDSSGSGPEHLRAITNQNGRFKGVIAHEGEDGDPAAGQMEWVPVRPLSKKLKSGNK